jgi:hypothetical protein
MASVFTAPGAAAYAKPKPTAVAIKEIGIIYFPLSCSLDSILKQFVYDKNILHERLQQIGRSSNLE